MDYLQKRLAARETTVAVDGHSYTIRRPTARQMAELSQATQYEAVQACVVGWDLTGLDLYPGGGPEPVPFDPAIWADWLADSPGLWTPLWEAITAQIAAHSERLETAAKN